MIQRIQFGVSLTLGILGLLSTGPALAQPTPIVSCGTVIGESGYYEVTSDLTASDAGTCITITAQNVTLSLTANITGIHAGVGISIREAGTVVRGAGTDHADIPTVSGFSIGVEDESGGNVIGDFDINANDTGLLLEGALTTPSVLDDLNVNGNAKDGIRIMAHAGVRGAVLTANNNGGRGIYVAPGSQNSVLSQFAARSNGSVGVDIQDSANIFYGCTVSGGKFGLVIAQGASGNVIVGCDDDGAPASNKQAFDKNGSCDQNLWYSNSFSGTATPRCTRLAKVGQTISKCGTIRDGGVYYLKKDLIAKNSDCLIVKAEDVTLNLNGHSLNGVGGVGIGLHVTSKAINFKSLNPDGENVQNFAIGVQIDADNATIKGLGTRNNANTGIFVNGARNVNLGQGGFNSNGKYGVHLLNASRLMTHNYSANSNGTYGVFVEHSNNNAFANFTAGNSGANGIAGLYIGCSASGPTSGCADIPSAANVVAHAAGALNTQYGWVVDTGSNRNVLVNLNGSGNGVFDMYDGNVRCARNLWFFDAFGTSNNPGCLN